MSQRYLRSLRPGGRLLLGKPIEDAFSFLETILLDVSVDRTTVVVLDKQLYEDKNWVVLYQISEEGDIISIPCAAHYAMKHLDSYQWLDWDTQLEDWLEEGYPISG